MGPRRGDDVTACKRARRRARRSRLARPPACAHSPAGRSGPPPGCRVPPRRRPCCCCCRSGCGAAGEWRACAWRAGQAAQAAAVRRRRQRHAWTWFMLRAVSLPVLAAVVLTRGRQGANTLAGRHATARQSSQRRRCIPASVSGLQAAIVQPAGGRRAAGRRQRSLWGRGSEAPGTVQGSAAMDCTQHASARCAAPWRGCKLACSIGRHATSTRFCDAAFACAAVSLCFRQYQRLLEPPSRLHCTAAAQGCAATALAPPPSSQPFDAQAPTSSAQAPASSRQGHSHRPQPWAGARCCARCCTPPGTGATPTARRLRRRSGPPSPFICSRPSQAA